MNSEKFPTLVWADLEMTGLDPKTDTIIEIATIITDDALEIVATGPELVINQPAELFEHMDDWNQQQHTQSGLWQQVQASSLSLEEAEQRTLEFIKRYIPEEKKGILCGNSIWQDRRFIRKYMPKIDHYLHYRMIDVSAIKELANRWYPQLAPFNSPVKAHRALDDIQQSIEELKYYRSHIFKATE